MMNTPTWAAVTNEQKKIGYIEPQSEFEKPYLGDSYDAMQHYYPPLNVNLSSPGGRFPDHASGMTDMTAQTKCTSCIIDCHDGSVRTGDCDKANGSCHVQIACFKGEILSGQRGQQYKWIVTGDPIDHIDYFSNAIRSERLSSGQSGGSGVAIEIYPKWNVIEETAKGNKIANYIVTLIDGFGHVCTDKVKVTCIDSCCPAITTFILGSNADTIAREASEIITVIGGCPPYIWAVSGTGFTMTDATTTGLTNTLNADATACGTATITITDDCGTSLTEYVRCTTGQWINKSNECVLPGTGELISGTWPTTSCVFQLISGNKRQTQSIERNIWDHGATPCDGNTTCNDIYECATGDGTACLDCIAPATLCACHALYYGGQDYCFCSSNTDYDEWEC